MRGPARRPRPLAIGILITAFALALGISRSSLRSYHAGKDATGAHALISNTPQPQRDLISRLHTKRRGTSLEHAPLGALAGLALVVLGLALAGALVLRGSCACGG